MASRFSKIKYNLPVRPRRLRKNSALREAVAETQLEAKNLVYPIFLVDGENQKQAIAAMPDQYRWSLDRAKEVLQQCSDKGILGVALFPVIDDSLKTELAEEALNEKGLIPQAIRMIKKEFPELNIFTDLALDPYSSAGHDGFVEEGEILNDPTVEHLAKMAVLHAECGADFVSPSDMMDGRVGVIRAALDECGFQNTGIMAYSAKYASSFYGPFRSALDSEPRFGDKKTYQMDFRNSLEALKEVELDISEGADIVMVKPALSYLDIISKVSELSEIPVAAYNVSGEYALFKLYEKEYGSAKEMMFEALVSIRRAGARIIFTYAALEVQV